jgi:hypothetical protein
VARPQTKHGRNAGRRPGRRKNLPWCLEGASFLQAHLSLGPNQKKVENEMPTCLSPILYMGFVLKKVAKVPEKFGVKIELRFMKLE